MDGYKPVHKTVKSNVPSRIFFFIVFIIVLTSWTIYNINLSGVQHSRNFIRTLNYHILGHQTFGVYWFGQEMNNYPIHQYYQLGHLQQFLKGIHGNLSHLQTLTYGEVDQQKLNSTIQNIYIMGLNGEVDTYQWTLQKGIQYPFNIYDIAQIKETLLQSISVHINLQAVDVGMGHRWNLIFTLEPFSQTSVFVQLIARQQIDLTNYHIVPFICGILLGIYLLWEYFIRPQNRLQNFLYYFLCLFLVLSSVLAFSRQLSFEAVFIFDGLTCCSAWLCSINFYTNQQDYKLSFLLSKSYMMIGRLFASFGPLLIAFSLFGYCVFCRYSGQFSSLWRTFMSLFYICYYNMTYQSAIVTSRSNPISLIFFIVFVLLFTICIYSGMLVSVFCSYVWGKRQMQIKADITNNLKIQCGNCDHKYKYTDRAKTDKKRSFSLYEYLQTDFRNPEECIKYKRVMIARINRLRAKADELIGQSVLYQKQISLEISHRLREEFWRKIRFIQNLVRDR